MADHPVTTEILVCPHCATPNRVIAGRDLTRSRCGSCREALSAFTPIDIEGDRFSRITARDRGAFLVDVWAPWCGPCRQFAPAFEAAAEAFGDRVRFFKVNADTSAAALQPYGIRGIPSLLAWRAGDLAARHAGALSAPQLLQWIETTFELPPAHQQKRNVS